MMPSRLEKFWKLDATWSGGCLSGSIRRAAGFFADSGLKQAGTDSCYLTTVLGLDLGAFASDPSMHVPDLIILQSC